MTDAVAFVDVGTNSIHMIVVDFSGGMPGTTVFQDKETVRMGRGLYETGALDRTTLGRISVVLNKFNQIAKEYGAEKVIAMATCAAREAPNSLELIGIANDCGMDLRVIPGKEEARLIRLGVLGINSARRTLCIDVGGGSTELALAEGNENLYLDSLSLGAVRMAYGSGIDQNGKVSVKQYDSLRRMVDEQSYRSVGILKSYGFEEVVGSSGTVEALADACAARRGDGDGSYLLRSELKALMKDMCALTAAQRGLLPKVSPGRAEIVIGGGVVVEELMDLLGIDRMTISRCGLREGMKMDYMMSCGNTDRSLRESSVRTLATRFGCNGNHEKTVEKYARMLYDEFTRIGLLSKGPLEELLTYAAQLIDVGTFINYDRHNIHSYTIIHSSYMAGFDSNEQEFIALLVRFHHGSFPKEDSRLFSGFPRRSVILLRKYALLLRFADILDRCRDDAVDEVSAEILNGNVNLTVVSDEDMTLSLWKLRSTSKDFEDVFGYRIHIDSLRV